MKQEEYYNSKVRKESQQQSRWVIAVCAVMIILTVIAFKIFL